MGMITDCKFHNDPALRAREQEALTRALNMPDAMVKWPSTGAYFGWDNFSVTVGNGASFDGAMCEGSKVLHIHAWESCMYACEVLDYLIAHSGLDGILVDDAPWSIQFEKLLKSSRKILKIIGWDEYKACRSHPIYWWLRDR